MRILFISTTFPDATSPARGTYNSALCAALAENHQVRVVAPRSFTESIPHRLRRQTYELPQPLAERGIIAEYPTYWYTPKVMQEKSGDQMWYSVRGRIKRIVRDFEPDAVLSYWAHPEGDVGVRTAQFSGIPAAVIVGGSDVLILPQLPRRGPRVRDVLLQSDAVITVSNGLRSTVRDLGVAAERVQTIYQGIDPTVFHQSQSRSAAQAELNLNPAQKHLVWVGRMVPVKALDVLIDAAIELRQGQLNYQLHLIGNGPERVRIERRVNELGLQDQVRFAGAIGHQQIASWYRAADLTVMSSDSEGLPNVLRESLACGTPFVATNVGSIEEIADHSYSLLVEKGNSSGLANAILQVLHGCHSENAAKFQPRTWKHTASETADLLERLSRSEAATTTEQNTEPKASEVLS